MKRAEMIQRAQQSNNLTLGALRALARNNHAHNHEDVKYETLMVLNMLTECNQLLETIEGKLNETGV